MSTFYMNWAAFEVATANVVDRTTYAVQIEHPDHEGIRLVVWHGEFPVGKTIRQLAAQRMAAEMVRLAGYAVVEQREVAWCDGPAFEFASQWRNEGITYYQRQVHFAPDGLWRSLALSGPLVSRAACDEWFEQIRASLRLKLPD
jgi:hypothetical protein